MREIGARHDDSPAELTIAWTPGHPAVAGAIAGGRRPDQVDGVVGTAELELTGDELDEIEAFLSENS